MMLGAGLFAQGAPAPQSAADQPTFRVQVDLVTTDVIPRDQNGNFLADLTKDEFEIWEDGVKQEITSMTVSHGGRIRNVLAPPPPVLASEGLILPPPRPVSDVSGRIFVFFVDDLHLQFGSTPRVRELFKKISKQLIHDGDLFGIVSSGPSSISVQMTYDKRRLEEAINKMTGAELKPEEIIEQSGMTNSAPSEVRYRVGVEYAGEERPQDPTLTHPRAAAQFSDAELTMMLAELTREANRSNVTMYTIDPRGLVGPLSDLDQEVEPVQWQEFVRKSQDSLRVLAEETGGLAVVNQNDFDKALERIDAETSDYYVLGYYSTNPDPTQRRRKIEVRVTRPNVSIWSRKEYVLKTVPVADTAPAAAPTR
jgi:VWFA-related protein